MLSELNNKPYFYQKNILIDKKIEFDQRFFTDGYKEFQLMISDVRAQIKINEDICVMKKLIENQTDIKINKILRKAHQNK